MAALKQQALILRHLREFGSITSLEAMQEYACMRLASRISELRQQGFSIRSELVTGKNRFGDPVHYAKYELMED